MAEARALELGSDEPAASAATAVPAAPMGLIWLALGVVYVVWGSTYLAIRVMVRDLPPLLASGARFVVAGAILALVLRLRMGRGALGVTRRQLRSCALLGVLLPACGNGFVSIGELTVPSGIAALLVAVIPLWVVLLRSASGDRPRSATWVGVLIGFVGLAVLVLPAGDTGGTRWVGVTLILLATTGWATGSWLAPRLELPQNPFVTTVYEMLVGGVAMLAGGLVRGEAPELATLGAAGGTSVAAWVYLVFAGSVLAFSSYVWLLRHAPLSLVATYAYVNPVVAVFLGWLLLAEPVTASVVAGGAIIVVGVAVVVSAERPRPTGDIGGGEDGASVVAPAERGATITAECRS
ncbi:MAG: EamA family transporter [Acidimicrobiales bacterium]